MPRIEFERIAAGPARAAEERAKDARRPAALPGTGLPAAEEPAEHAADPAAGGSLAAVRGMAERAGGEGGDHRQQRGKLSRVEAGRGGGMVGDRRRALVAAEQAAEQPAAVADGGIARRAFAGDDFRRRGGGGVERRGPIRLDVALHAAGDRRHQRGNRRLRLLGAQPDARRHVLDRLAAAEAGDEIGKRAHDRPLRW